MTLNQQAYLLFVGAYAEVNEAGIRSFRMSSDSGELTPLFALDGLKSPTFLTIDHEAQKLYAITQQQAEGQEANGAVAVIDFEQNGSMRLIQTVPSVARPTCHIQLDASKKFIIVTSYHGGMIGTIPVLEDGSLGNLAGVVQHEGAGPHVRQDRPHPHSAFADPANRYYYVSDLGTDRIYWYQVETNSLALQQVGQASVHPGAGPRHLAFHRSLPKVYVINELDSTVTVFDVDALSGQLTAFQTISTLPSGVDGKENTCAEIQLSADGRTLYGSNRGDDSIVMFRVNEADGSLTLLGHVASGGKQPRHFSLTPDGRFCVAAHQDTGELAVFSVDAETGMLKDTKQRGEAAKGVCVQFWHSPIE